MASGCTHCQMLLRLTVELARIAAILYMIYAVLDELGTLS